MGIAELAHRLATTSRVGLDEALSKQLGLPSEDATRGRLMGEQEGDLAHLGVYLLATYVVDDTDFWGDGEIYWYSIPAHVDREGKTQKSVLHTLPNGMPPHKVGSLEWMTNLSLNEPPLLAVIPPTEDLASLVLRFCVYDDDGAVADFPKAMGAGFAAWGEISKDPLPGAEQIITPVRDAIFKALKAEEDDILVDQDVILRRGETTRFGRGMIGSVVTALARLYYFVKDEEHTLQFGPVALHKGQTETIKFDQPMKGGGRLTLFARGAEVHCSTFGNLDTDTPFVNRVIESRNEVSLAQGFNVTALGAAKLIAFYTPP